MIEFDFAKNNAVTWEDFWGLCSSETKQFILPFAEGDDSVAYPELSTLLDGLTGWFIFDDFEFVLTQCAEETTTLFSEYLPNHLKTDSISTEYGHQIDLYSLDTLDKIRSESKKKGINATFINAPFVYTIRNY